MFIVTEYAALNELRKRDKMRCSVGHFITFFSTSLMNSIEQENKSYFYIELFCKQNKKMIRVEYSYLIVHYII